MFSGTLAHFFILTASLLSIRANVIRRDPSGDTEGCRPEDMMVRREWIDLSKPERRS